jgi:hypothetical protein
VKRRGAAPAPKRTLLERLTDWPNPVVVKELRQAVNGRFTGAVLISLLCLQLLIIALSVLFGDVERFAQSRGMGRELFATLQATLLFSATVAMPLYAGVRAMMERTGNNLDLLYVTTLPPRQIVSGKLQAASLLTALVYVASLPLMSLCYLLRGIDLPSMAVVVAGGFLLVVNAIVLALAVGCLPAGRLLRILFAVGFLALLMMVMGFATALARWAITSGMGSRVTTWAFWQVALVMVALDLLGMRLVFLLTVAMVSPPTSNRALPVRRFLALLWVLTLGAAAVSALLVRAKWPLEGWMYLATWSAAPLLLAAASGRDRPSAAVVRQLPRNAVLRLLAFPFVSGAPSGFAFALLWLTATLYVGWALQGVLPAFVRFDGELPGQLTIVAAYLLGYAGTSAMLVRGPLRRWLKPHQTWVIALFLAALGSTLPPILAFMLDPHALQQSQSFGPWLALNPGIAFREETHELATRVAWVWTGLVAAGGARWWLRRAGELALAAPAPAPAARPA